MVMNMKLMSTVDSNIKQFKRYFENNAMVKYRNIKSSRVDAYLIFQDGMSSGDVLDDRVIKPLLKNRKFVKTIEEYISVVLYASQCRVVKTIEDCNYAILSGDSVLVIDGYDEAIVIDTKTFNFRGNDESNSEKILRGPKECFNEVLMKNTALIRRRLQSTHLKIETMYLDTKMHEQIALCYLDTKVNRKQLDDLKQRLNNVLIKDSFDTNTLAEKISDAPFSIFQTMGISERADIICSKINEGKIAIVVDGTCEVMWAPYVYLEAFHAPDDYYLPYVYASVSRLIRIIGYYIAVFLPAIYLSIINYHVELLDWKMLSNILRMQKLVPFSSLVEVLVIVVCFELLKEATLRGPSQLSGTLGVISGIIFGDAIISANLISSIMLLVMAFSALCSIMNIRLQSSIFILKIGFIFLSYYLGLYGICVGIILLIIYMHKLKSLNVSFATPVYSKKGLDGYLRIPSFLWK